MELLSLLLCLDALPLPLGKQWFVLLPSRKILIVLKYLHFKYGKALVFTQWARSFPKQLPALGPGINLLNKPTPIK